MSCCHQFLCPQAASCLALLFLQQGLASHLSRYGSAARDPPPAVKSAPGSPYKASSRRLLRQVNKCKTDRTEEAAAQGWNWPTSSLETHVHPVIMPSHSSRAPGEQGPSPGTTAAHPNGRLEKSLKRLVMIIKSLINTVSGFLGKERGVPPRVTCHGNS